MLLVEDDEHLRQYIARLLASEGYRVEEAEDEGQALSAASRTDFGVVVTDLGLPGIGGVALIELLAERQKATTFVIVTGLLDEELPSSPILDRTIVAVLTKPLDRDEFAVLLEGVGTEELALQAAHRIPEILEFPLKCARGMPVSFSIGMSLHPAHGDTVDELLATADCAMYRAKRARTGQISVASRKTEGPN